MQPSYWSGAIDCPACGACAESHLALAWIDEDGTTIRCGVCRYTVWDGAVVNPGRPVTPGTVIRRVCAARPGIDPADAYREPWELRLRLTLEPAPGDRAWGRNERRKAAHAIELRIDARGRGAWETGR